MITVSVTGLVIPSANNIVNYVVFISSRLFKGIYIFQQDITLNKVHPCVYIRDYFLRVREPYTLQTVYPQPPETLALDVVVYSKSLSRPSCL